MSYTLSGGVDTWFIDQFKNTLYLVCQKTEALLAQAVQVETVVGAEDKAFDMLGELALVEKTGRNVDTPTQDVSTQRRWVSTTPYHQSIRKDRDDDLSMLIDPTSKIVTSLRQAVNRKKDTIILAAFDATVQAGRRAGDSTITWAAQDGNTKYTESSGGRTIPFDCSEGNCDASQTGMTVEKIELIQEYMAHNHVDPGIPLWCLISPRQRTHLFGQQEYVNIDYNNAKPLASGHILGNWHGINWIVSPDIVKGTDNDVDGSDDVYECWAWAQDAIILGVADELTVEMSVLPEKSYSQQIYVHMNMGAMRMDEDKVLKIECV